MATRLSKNRQYMYFPIDWNKPVNSRALAYFVAREHSTLVRQIGSMFKNKLVRSEVHHEHPKFSVWCYELTPEQVAKYVKKYSAHMFSQLPQSYQKLVPEKENEHEN